MPRSVPGRELALIASVRSRADKRSRHLRLGIGDDCAVLAPPRGHEILVTTDFSLEGRHFRRDWHSGQSAGHRTLARGLSDIAAMGAQPLAAFLSLAVPRELARKPAWLDAFFDGLLALAQRHNVPLAGGDTAEAPSGEVLADIVVVGSAPAGRAILRSGASAGDVLYVTGSLGGAHAELAAVGNRAARFRKAASQEGHPHLFPQPRLAVGQTLLRRRIATACIDISDGLSTDLAHLCDESSVSAEIDEAALPLHPLTRSLPQLAALSAALHGGEDYELLFTAGPETRVPRSIAGVGITRIGKVLRKHRSRSQVTLVEATGKRSALAPGGWQHL